MRMMAHVLSASAFARNIAYDGLFDLFYVLLLIQLAVDTV